MIAGAARRSAAAPAAVAGKLKTKRAAASLVAARQHARPARKLVAKRMRARDREARAGRALSRALRADRSVGDARRRLPRACRRPRSHRSPRLMVTDTSRNLVRVFFLREKLKSLADGEWAGQPGARDRRRRDGRRHRRLVRAARLHGHARRHEARAARPGDRARGRRCYGKIGHKRIDDPRRARPADPRSQPARACAPPIW